MYVKENIKKLAKLMLCAALDHHIINTQCDVMLFVMLVTIWTFME